MSATSSRVASVSTGPASPASPEPVVRPAQTPSTPIPTTVPPPRMESPRLASWQAGQTARVGTVSCRISQAIRARVPRGGVPMLSSGVSRPRRPLVDLGERQLAGHVQIRGRRRLTTRAAARRESHHSILHECCTRPKPVRCRSAICLVKGMFNESACLVRVQLGPPLHPAVGSAIGLLPIAATGSVSAPTSTGWSDVVGTPTLDSPQAP